MDLSQLVWDLLVLSICIFEYIFQNCFPYLTSLGNLYVVFILFVNPRHQFCIHWISFVICLPIIFCSMILNFVLFFSILFCSGFLKPVLYVPKHYCGRAYFLLTSSTMIFTYRMTLFFSSAFTWSLPIYLFYSVFFFLIIGSLYFCWISYFVEVVIPFNGTMWRHTIALLTINIFSEAIFIVSFYFTMFLFQDFSGGGLLGFGFPLSLNGGAPSGWAVCCWTMQEKKVRRAACGGKKVWGWFIVHGESLLCFHFLALWRICNLLSLPYWISCFNKFTYASLIFTLKISFLVSWKIEFFSDPPCVVFIS